MEIRPNITRQRPEQQQPIKEQAKAPDDKAIQKPDENKDKL